MSSCALPEIGMAELERRLATYAPRRWTDGDGDEWVSGLFVRWSTDPAGDCHRGYSTDWAAGQSEMGLSCNELLPVQTWHGLDLGTPLIERVREYRFLPGRPWLVEGYRPAWSAAAMRGSDNEPLVIRPRPVAWINITQEA